VTNLYDVFVKSASKPTVLCDVDNTLAWTQNQLLAMLNAVFGTNLKLSEITVYHFEANLPLEQSTWLKQQYLRSITFANVAPDFHAIDAINTIHDRGYQVVIGTSRDSKLQGVTKQWLDEWGVKYDDLRVGTTAKQDYARTNSNLVAIDDDPSAALDLANLGAEVLVPDRTYTPEWCKSSNIKNVQVFNDWNTVLTRLA
jgi:uncharacterized HAD superfamily protein